MPHAITPDRAAHGGDVGAFAPPATLLHHGRRIALEPPGISIGRRSDNDLVLEGERVSRHHARIAASDGRWYVADLGSMNGTLVNGVPVREQHLHDGDEISVGETVLRFEAS